MGMVFSGSHFTVQVVAMALTALLLPRLTISSFLGPVAAVLVLSVINVLYWDVELFQFIPMSFNTRVLSLLAINGAIFWIVVKLVPGIEVKGFFPALTAPVLFSAITILLTIYLPDISFTDIFTLLANLLRDAREYFLQGSSSAVPVSK